MVKDKKIDSFFKRKRVDCEAQEIEEVPEPESEETQFQETPVQPPLLLLEFGQQSHEEEGQKTHTNEAVFRGTEFLERDPAVRPQIWQYPHDQRDEVRRAYLKLGPMQPRLQNYKPSGTEGHQRRFQYNWFGMFPSWLEYSESHHQAYCLFCFLFSKNKNKRGGSDVFTVHGFSNWKKVNNGRKCAFLSHLGSEPCSEHNNATKACRDLLNRQAHIQHIAAVGNQRDIERNQLRVKISIATVKWLTSQSCAFRGHDETAESKNQGNFLELRKLLAEFNPEIAEVIRDAKYNEQYIAPKIQQEILGIYAFKVRNHIREEIGDSKFAILVDETCDVAKREQMALVLRFVDKDGILQERFFDLIHVTSTKAATLKEVLSSMLSKNAFDVQNLRGQGYDGASNMRGEFNGLQALFLRECPYAYYVHCYAHRLQLALVAASKEVVPVAQFFQKLLFIVNTVDSSAKRHDELHDAQLDELARLLAIDDIETGQGANQIRALKRPGDTRWGSHLGSISTRMSNVCNTAYIVKQM